MGSTYGAVLRLPGATLFSLTGAVARLPLSMSGLGLVLVVSDRTGSYATAGTVAAAYVLAAAALAPVQGRLLDRIGQPLILWICGAIYLVGMAATITAIDAGTGAPLVHLAAALTGVATPQTGNMVRARWTHIVADRRLLNTAYALEAVLDEAVFIVGPVLVTYLTLQVHEFAGLTVAAASAVLGSWALALQRSTAPPFHRRSTSGGAPIGWGLLGPVVAASVGLGVLFGSTEVIVVAVTTEQGSRGAAGTILAIWALGSLAAGILVGALAHPVDPLRRLRRTIVLLSLLFAPLLFISDIAHLAIGMFLAGVMISPTLIAAMGLVEAHVPRARLTEALAWTTTGLSVGVAPGAAAAGWVVDHSPWGASTAFCVPLVAGLAASVVAWTFHPPPLVNTAPADH